MINFKHIEVPGVGAGFSVESSTVPMGSLLTMMSAVKVSKPVVFRYSVEGAEMSEWQPLNRQAMKDYANSPLTNVRIECVEPTAARSLRTLSAIAPLVNDEDDGFYFLYPEVVIEKGENIGIQEVICDGYWVLEGDFDAPDGTHTIYDRSIFYKFFDSNDEVVLGWAFNVLEKLYNPGIIPLYISRENQKDYTALFLATTQLFAYIVFYARKYRDFEAEENNERGGDEMLRAFIEGWGLSYNNIDTAEERRYLFQHWIEQFHKRGTIHIADKQEEVGDQLTTLEGELRRLVAYSKPNEFLFAPLAPESVGWCVGYSSPTWYGTETVPNVSKGWDYGIGYLPDSVGQGVGQLADYPVIGSILREKDGNLNVFRFTGNGRVGITTEKNTAKALEVYRGLNYEVTVWVKALNEGKPQNLDFGVLCYDEDMVPVRSICLTNGASTNSFFQGEEKGEVNSPCKISGVYYRLTGTVYGILEEIDDYNESNEPIYLNFENGRPLRFFSNNVRYMAPYIVQDKTGDVSDIYVAGITVKPMNLFSRYETYNKTQVVDSDIPVIPSGIGFEYPTSEFEWNEMDGTPMLTQISEVGQGYLGHKNVVAFYSQIATAQSKSEVEAFMRRYLLSYKNILMGTWLDYIVRYTVIATIIVRDSFDGTPIEGAVVTVSGGTTEKPVDLEAYTDEFGAVRFEVEYDAKGAQWFNYSVTFGEASKNGTFSVERSDVEIYVDLDIPVEIETVTVPKGAGYISISGSRVPGTDILVTETPVGGYVFLGWRIDPAGIESTESRLSYHIEDKTPLTITATYERNAELAFIPSVVEIPARGDSATATLSSSREWVIDPVSVDWLEVTPTSGEGGDNEITFGIK